MDLAREDIHIAIQWETAADAKNKTIQGVSKEWIRDIETYKQDGKLLFGWAINSDLTQRPGALKFSVRFYHLDGNDKMDFSLNTLTSSVAISPSIDYKIISETETNVGEIIDNADLILNRLVDSVTPPGLEEAEAPVFLAGRDMPQGFKTVEGEKEFESVDLGNDNKYEFSVKAVSNEGTISYQWFHAPLGENENIVNTPPYSFILTKDKEYSGDYPYYIKEERLGEAPAYKVVTDITQDMIGTPIEREEDLYEKVGFYTATSTGDYRVEAINSNGLATKATEGRWIVRIPGPGNEFIVDYADGQ